MKKMKKIFAMLLALTMVLGMTMTASAANSKPVPENSAIATIENVDSAATIKVYQIVDAQYNEHGLVNYIRTNGLTEADLADIYNPTYVEIMEIAKKTTLTEYTTLEDNSAVTWTYDSAKESSSASLNAGTYLVKITTTGAVVYNPMIVSIGYKTTENGNMNELQPGSVDAGTSWSLPDTKVVAKSSDITAEKTGDDATPDVTPDDNNVEVGAVVDYTITTTIPVYSSEYTTAIFKVKDTIVNGLEYVNNSGTMVEPVVTVGGVTPAAGSYTFEAGANNESFTISFESNYILGLATATEEERAVVVTYSATVTSDAIVNVGENKVSLIYTTKPNDFTEADKDTEYVYTVTLKGVFGKTDENDAALEGATFALYEGVAESEAMDNGTLKANYVKLILDDKSIVYGKDINKTSTSLSDGSINFEGLDADKTYYLKETVAPSQYTLNDKVYTITFANLIDTDSDNIKDTYDVLVDGTKKGTIAYGQSLTGTLTKIPNIKLIALPSTGGIGTTIFTVAGCGIMIAAAFFFFASRKKEN